MKIMKVIMLWKKKIELIKKNESNGNMIMIGNMKVIEDSKCHSLSPALRFLSSPILLLSIPSFPSHLALCLL
jgi:hypothetical protein